jgi:hypothetical protein
LIGFSTRRLTVGQPLPSIPLFLSTCQGIPIDLEQTYDQAARRAYLE